MGSELTTKAQVDDGLIVDCIIELGFLIAGNGVFRSAGWPTWHLS